MKLKITFGVAVLAASLVLTGCGAGSPDPNTESSTSMPTVNPNTDPRKGWVDIQIGALLYADGSTRPSEYGGSPPKYQQISKICDGSTLVYSSSGHESVGLFGLANSPECQ